MGLDVSHNCFSGSYTRFYRWRGMLVRVAWNREIKTFKGYGGNYSYPQDDALTYLIDHTDDCGQIDVRYLAPLIARLKELLPEIGYIWDLREPIKTTVAFISGLEEALSKKEPVKFR